MSIGAKIFLLSILLHQNLCTTHYSYLEDIISRYKQYTSINGSSPFTRSELIFLLE